MCAGAWWRRKGSPFVEREFSFDHPFNMSSNPVLDSARQVIEISQHVKLNHEGIKRAAQPVSTRFHLSRRSLTSKARRRSSRNSSKSRTLPLRGPRSPCIPSRRNIRPSSSSTGSFSSRPSTFRSGPRSLPTNATESGTNRRVTARRNKDVATSFGLATSVCWPRSIERSRRAST